jgi:predicted nucleotide-binding protein (sugar kinase/HSP70/actin superfamily)
MTYKEASISLHNKLLALREECLKVRAEIVGLQSKLDGRKYEISPELNKTLQEKLVKLSIRLFDMSR